MVSRRTGNYIIIPIAREGDTYYLLNPLNPGRGAAPFPLAFSFPFL